MAKNRARSGKPSPGGRVTPKGVRPQGVRTAADTAGTGTGNRPPMPRRIDPTHGTTRGGKVGPTRAGHHRGQR
ncbi:MAG TPA: hypothetical protein VIR58_11125 [Acidimicrobiales bacterium]